MVFLSVPVAASSGVLSAAGLGMKQLRQTRLHLPARRIPLMGLSAAFIFACQMLNFPIAGGTSGHLVGGVLAVGPARAGAGYRGVSLGADHPVFRLRRWRRPRRSGPTIFNMGIVSSVGGYYLYRLVWLIFPGRRGQLLAIAFASWCATVLAAIVCAGELALSKTIPWSVAFPAMTNVHMLIGIGEAIITTLVVLAVLRTRPELVEGNQPRAELPTNTGKTSELVVFGLLIAMGLAIFVSPFACAWPDGLDRVAKKFGFQAREVKSDRRVVPSPVPDYLMPGIHSAVVATAAAGALGTLAAFGMGLVLARTLVPENKDDPDVPASPRA